MTIDMRSLLTLAVEKNASDVHLSVPRYPTLRILGELIPLPEMDALTPEDLDNILVVLMNKGQQKTFLQNKELDFAFSLPDVGRFRVNAYYQRGTIAFAIRVLPAVIPSMEELGLPAVCKELAVKPRGMVLVTGATGYGKSTTLASMIEYLNQTVSRRVVTIEDPIEFVHTDNKCYIVQREVGSDTESFAEALRHALRQDPNVILLGEMRDLETIRVGLTAAETGHLVLCTLHTSSAAQTVERMIDIFPPEQQQQVRTQLALVLEGVLSQVLIPRADNTGRVAAFEVMLATNAIRSLIREAKTHEIPNYILLGRREGMCLLDQALAELVRQGTILRDDALARAHDPKNFSVSSPR